MLLESPKNTVNASAEKVYTFLTKIENFEQLMPENHSKFELINDSRFLFALKGMPDIVLDLKEGIPHSKVVLGAASDKIPFTLTANINALTPNSAEVGLTFEGQFNAMMAMMVKKPITTFIETLSSNMSKIA